MGVVHLQKKLSDLLIDAIKRTLPSIKKEIEDKLEKVRIFYYIMGAFQLKRGNPEFLLILFIWQSEPIKKF